MGYSTRKAEGVEGGTKQEGRGNARRNLLIVKLMAVGVLLLLASHLLWGGGRVVVGQAQDERSAMENNSLTTTTTANSSVNLYSTQIQSIVLRPTLDTPPCQEATINAIAVPLSFPYCLKDKLAAVSSPISQRHA